MPPPRGVFWLAVVLEAFRLLRIASGLLTLALYETLVRPDPAVRWLFGMAPPVAPSRAEPLRATRTIDNRWVA